MISGYSFVSSMVVDINSSNFKIGSEEANCEEKGEGTNKGYLHGLRKRI